MKSLAFEYRNTKKIGESEITFGVQFETEAGESVSEARIRAKELVNTELEAEASEVGANTEEVEENKPQEEDDEITAEINHIKAKLEELNEKVKKDKSTETQVEETTLDNLITDNPESSSGE